ncbi:hypothetical protein NW762_006946 [Fusarium torreyae]|uniref:Uncharacterized protein n=1 Tax=Fusarium torreyae TaxID=1237075 RepID=A0A9W8RZT9_9HYPO|nr:hypothetical protein NW762_006946 [Fusarium torreyae]
MAGNGRSNTKKSSETKDDGHQASQQATSDVSLAPGARWRPGRDPANREINLGLRRSQRLREKHEAESPQRASHTQDTPPSNSPAGSRQGYSEPTANSSEIFTSTSAATPEPQRRARRPIPPDWKPPLAIGESLGKNLSRLEKAERSVLQWEAIIENARVTQPLADLSGLERQLGKVKQKFEEMEECDENLIPVDELASTKRKRVQDRMSLLTASLERNECPVGDINIRAAINAYETGQIKCWDKWTVLYAGHVADFCPSYESFTLDREERLDRYYSLYGEGWLWYEPPLAPRGNYQPEQLMAATWAQPTEECGLVSGYAPFGWEIHMGFRRVRGFHDRVAERLRKPRRRSQNGKVLLYQTRIREPGSSGRATCFVEDEDDDKAAPRVCFKMQLDSGATHPSLHNSDLDYIGIDRETYPAQTHTSVETANSSTVARIYEMRVDVCRHNGESLVGDNPVYPEDRRQLGGIVPVMVLVESTDDQSEPLDEWYKEALKNGEGISEEAMAERYRGQKESRLSGMLPFQVCYFSGAPGNSTFWFGEDRRDVLGADRMPGQQRWERHKAAQGAKRPDEVADLDRPTVVFKHQKNDMRLLDVDSREDPSASVLTLDGRNGSRQLLLKPGEKTSERFVAEPPKRKVIENPSTPLKSWPPKKRQRKA